MGEINVENGRLKCQLLEKINSGAPLTSSEIAKIAKIAKDEIKFLARNNIPLTPINYFMWFEVFCYIKKQKKEFSDSEIIGLFKERYPDENIIKETLLKINKTDRELMGKLAKEIDREVSNVIGNIEKHNKLLEYKNREFKKNAKHINDGSLKNLLDSLSKSIEEIKEQNCYLKDKLQESKNQVEKLSEKLKDAEKSALIEFLASIATKNGFEKALKDMFLDFKERNYPFAIFMIKIDNYEKLMEKYSENIVNDILDKVAKKLKQLLRSNDVIAYYDDNIFGILVPGTTFGHAIRIGERIRKSVEDKIINIDKNIIKITSSIGIAVARNDSKEDEIIDRALKAVYLAEKSGGNTVKTDLDVELEL